MKMRTSVISCLCATLVVLAALGCVRHTTKPVASDISLAVAAFTQPTDTRELLGGYLPSNSQTAKMKSLGELDAYLANELITAGKRTFSSAASTRSCQESAKEDLISSQHSGLDYWVRVGECAGRDYLLVPQLLYWKERVGGPAGSNDPAGVTLDMYVVNVKDHSIVSRMRFEETQVSLTDNLLTMPQFFARGAKWVTATELAKYGIGDGLKKLGLI